MVLLFFRLYDSGLTKSSDFFHFYEKRAKFQIGRLKPLIWLLFTIELMDF